VAPRCSSSAVKHAPHCRVRLTSARTSNTKDGRPSAAASAGGKGAHNYDSMMGAALLALKAAPCMPMPMQEPCNMAAQATTNAHAESAECHTARQCMLCCPVGCAESNLCVADLNWEHIEHPHDIEQTGTTAPTAT
jgi:hypothetical protein